MAQCEAAAGHFGTTWFLRRLRGLENHARLTVAVCVVLICGSFASAALIQMRMDRTHALSQSARFTSQRAAEMATDAGATLDRYRAIASAFASAEVGAETSAALSEAAGAALKNIVVLGRRGELISELRGPPEGMLPPVSRLLELVHAHQTIVTSHDRHSIVLLFALEDQIVAAEIDPSRILPRNDMGDGVLALSSGTLVALGSRWNDAPPPAALMLAKGAPVTRLVQLSAGSRLLSLAPAPHWPLVAGASVQVGEALAAWYGAMPLYLFFILGPSLAGAALAVLFVRTFERHAKAAAAIRTLRSTRPDEARLLVRLADAERRAAEASRARDRFVSQVSHELRTPLNAIIGFAEVIEAGVFGEPGHKKYVEYARDISEAGRELHAKIGSVLEYAALNTPHEAVRNDERDAVANAAEFVRIKLAERAGVARQRGLKLVVSLPDSVMIRAEPDPLSRIFDHLLDNALAYTPRGGTVRVEIRSNGREAIVAIRDSGPGFSARERTEAGQPFQRFARPGAAGGMGVGLSIAMGLARRIGAVLALSSPPGGGTLVELRLALAHVED